MKKTNILIIFFLLSGIIFFSCGNSEVKDYTSTPNAQGNPEREKVIGLWKIDDPSGNPDKVMNYLFQENGSGYKYPGSNSFLIQAETFTYDVSTQNGISRITMTNEKSQKTVFKINDVDEHQMKIIMEVVDNETISNSGVKEMQKEEQ